MAVYLSEKFKQFRKARDLTQEQIADIFNVSPQTVSRWETGTNYPDIEMLPALADFFEVSVDDLLGVNVAKNQKRASQFAHEVHEKFRKNLFDEAIEICRNGISEFPADYNLQSWLANVLMRKSGDVPGEESKKYIREVISIRERILENCSNGSKNGRLLISGSIQQLAYAYHMTGDKEKAFEMAESLPFYASNIALFKITEEAEKFKNGIENILLFAETIKQHIEILTHSESDSGLHEKIINIMNICCKNYESNSDEAVLTCETEKYKAVFAELENYAQIVKQ